MKPKWKVSNILQASN